MIPWVIAYTSALEVKWFDMTITPLHFWESVPLGRQEQHVKELMLGTEPLTRCTITLWEDDSHSVLIGEIPDFRQRSTARLDLSRVETQMSLGPLLHQ